MNTRLAITAQKALRENAGQDILMLDAYNNAVQTDVAVTITTRIYACNHYWIMEQGKQDYKQIPQKKYPTMTTDQHLNVITLFSGYDSQALALNRLGLPYDLAAWCEIDRHAITAHNALFPQWKDRNLGDVSQVDWAEWHASHPQTIDLLTYSSPCQDFSSAGLQRGGEEGSGTRSGLLWETERAVRELRPRHLVFENVGGLVSDKFIDLFNRWQARLNTYGYTNFQQLMNAKDYGVPQNRLRIFMVSILDCQRTYYFPKPFKLERRLKDVLEQNVEERYYLKEEQVAKLLGSIDKQVDDTCIINRPHGYFDGDINKDYNPAIAATEAKVHKFVAEPQIDRVGRYNNGQSGMVYGTEGVSPTIDASAPEHGRGVQIVEPQSLLIPQATKEGYAVVPEGGVFDASYPDSTTRRGRVQEGGTVSPTIMASQNELLGYEGTERKIEPYDSFYYHQSAEFFRPPLHNVARALTTTQPPGVAIPAQTGIRIRRLTERELYRLMDVEEKDIDTLLSAPIPRTQHAKLAGNSIVVSCLYYIFKNIFVNTEPDAGTQTKLF